MEELQKVVYLLMLKKPLRKRLPAGRAEKPLVLVPGLGVGVAGSHPKPEPAVVFVVVDFITAPAVRLVVQEVQDVDVSAGVVPECNDITNLFQSESEGTRHPSGHNFLGSLTAYQLYK